MAGEPNEREPEWVSVRQPLAGLYDRDNIDLVPLQGLSVAKNITYRNSALEKRPGLSLVGDQIGGAGAPESAQWIGQYRTSSVDELLVVAAGKLYKYNTGTGLWKGAISGANPGTSADLVAGTSNFLTAVQFGTFLFFSGGTSARWLYTGSAIIPWGYTISGMTAPTLGAETSGGLLTKNRNYTVRYTYEHPTTGFETAPSTTSAVVTPSTDTRRFPITIPANASWDPALTIVNVYRSKGIVVPGEAVEWYLEEKITGVAGLDTTAITGHFISKADVALTDKLVTDAAQVPIHRYSIAHEERIFVAGLDSPNRSLLAWSDDENPHSFPAGNAMYIQQNEGDIIVGLFRMLGRLYVLTETSIWMVTSDGQGGYVQTLLFPGVGGVSHFSIVSEENITHWLSAKGFIEFTGQSPMVISEPISSPMKSTLRELNIARCAAACDQSTEGDPRRFLVPREASDRRKQWIFWPRNRAWTQDETANSGTTPGNGEFMLVMASIRTAANVRTIYGADKYGQVFRFGTNLSDVEVRADKSAAYETVFSTPWFGDGTSTITPMDVAWELERSPDGATGTYTCKLYLDGNPTAYDSTTFNLYDSTDTTPDTQSGLLGAKKSKEEKCGAKDGAECRRFRWEWVCNSATAHLKILRYKLRIIGLNSEIEMD